MPGSTSESALPYIFSLPIYAKCKRANIGTTSKEETMAKDKEKEKGKSDKSNEKSNDKSKGKNKGKSSKK